MNLLSDGAKKWLADRLLPRPTVSVRTRAGECVTSFAMAHPDATRIEWARFAIDLAEAFYREGMTGEEPEAEVEEVLPSPEEIADQLDPSWREHPMIPRGSFAPPATYPTDDDMIRDAAERLRAKVLR